jgi:hypothetical protein
VPPPSPPAPVERLAAQLAGLPGAVAVALGGSRATAAHRPDSDWDLGLYYRAAQQPLDPADVRALGHSGHVSKLGEWGPLMDGGGWLTLDGIAIDVLFRDLDAAERRLAAAERGEFEILAQNGYLAGAPTYLSVGELALCRPLAGELPRPAAFPAALAASAPPRWRGKAGVALLFAQMHAREADAVGCAGLLAEAVLCAAHARLAERREWVLNEKRLVRRAGLDALQPLLAEPGATAASLAGTADAVARALGIAPLAVR